MFGQLYSLGRYAEAHKVNEEYALQMEMLFDGEHPAYLSYLNNKALLLKHDGKLEKAMDIYSQVLLKYREYYRGSTGSMAVVLLNLGLVKQQLGRAEEALEHIEEAITIKTNIGEDETSLAHAVAMKASVLKDLKQFEESKKLLRGAYEVTAIKHGEHSAQAASILSAMAMLEKAKGNYSGA